jgi:hypothetical protein
VSHNSSKKGIDVTIKALFKLVKPHQIYVADNGSSYQECVDTDALCNSLSEEYYRDYPDMEKTFIQVSHLSIGNKTFAQYSCVHSIVSKADNGLCSVKYLTIIDDDVIVPLTWRFQSIEKHFEDRTKIALAYPLSADNASENIITRHQDMEYLSGNCDRFGWYRFGNQLFASGAIATWRIRPFLKVLERHCACFNGEDLEMGYLVHKLCDEKTTKLGIEHEARFGYMDDCIVPTIVPSCSVHWFDFLYADIKKKYKFTCKKCGVHSFFNQRLRSWDCAGHAFLVKYFRVVIAPRGWSYKHNNFIRFICFWKIFCIYRDFACFGTWIFFLVKVLLGSDGISYALFLADTAWIAWAVLFLYFSLVSYKLSKNGKSFPPESIFVEPILVILQITLMNSFACAIYSLFYYFWIPFPPPIKKQIESNQQLEHELHHAWDNNRLDQPQVRHGMVNEIKENDSKTPIITIISKSNDKNGKDLENQDNETDGIDHGRLLLNKPSESTIVQQPQSWLGYDGFASHQSSSHTLHQNEISETLPFLRVNEEAISTSRSYTTLRSASGSESIEKE